MIGAALAARSRGFVSAGKKRGFCRLPFHQVVAVKLSVRIALLALCPTLAVGQPALTLHYRKPADVWTEALPIGNGRLGAMIFGGINEDLIQLNEATLWSGGPVADNINPKAYDFLAPARAALRRGEYGRAADLLRRMQGPYTQSYLPLGDVVIQQDTGQGKRTDYSRDLSLQSGVASTTFSIDGVHYKREVFASAPANVIVMRLPHARPQAAAHSRRRRPAPAIPVRAPSPGRR